jgi:hypothetical protein
VDVMSAGLGESARRAQKTIYTNMSVKLNNNILKFLKSIIKGALIGYFCFTALKIVWMIGVLIIEINKYK